MNINFLYYESSVDFIISQNVTIHFMNENVDIGHYFLLILIQQKYRWKHMH